MQFLVVRGHFRVLKSLVPARENIKDDFLRKFSIAEIAQPDLDYSSRSRRTSVTGCTNIKIMIAKLAFALVYKG